jgi:hypothetical protein
VGAYSELDLASYGVQWRHDSLLQELMMTEEVQTEEVRVIRVTFNDGKTRTFAYDPVQVDASNFATAVDKMMESKNLILELDDSVLVIPFTSILYYEIAPKPKLKIPNTLKVQYEFE